MITLYTFPEAFGLRNVSPFCLKVEMALKHLGLDFDIVLESDPRKSPKGKLPYIVADGETIADSEIILEYLDERTGGGLYGKLQPGEYGRGMAYTRLIEDHLYWLLVASRWLEDDWFPNVRQGFFSSLPPVVGTLVGNLARRQIRRTYQLHGLGRHSREEQAGFAHRDLQALSDTLSQQAYIAGDRLTVFDFSAASLLAGLYDNRPATWVTDLAGQYHVPREYAERIQQELGVYCRK